MLIENGEPIARTRITGHMAKRNTIVESLRTVLMGCSRFLIGT